MEGVEERVRPLLPTYMSMGHTGMDMGKMAEVMPYPKNTIAMKGATGPFGDYISMGGLFTVVRCGINFGATMKIPAGTSIRLELWR